MAGQFEDANHLISLVPDAIAAVRIEARSEALDLLERRGPASAPDLLRGHSADFAGSPIGRDQLFGVALDKAADAIDRGDPTARIDIASFLEPRRLAAEERTYILLLAADMVSSGEDALVRHAESLLNFHQRREADCAEAAQRLLLDAALNRQLWDDERLSIGRSQRAFMLASSDHLERLAALTPPGSLWRRLLRGLRKR